MNHLTGRKRKAFLLSIEAFVIAILVSGAICLNQTFGNVQPPIVLHEPAMVSVYPIDSRKHAHEVHISRDITYKELVPVIFSTKLTNKDQDYTIDLQDTKVSADKIGTVNSHKLYYVSHLMPGHWCVQTSVYWTPFFTLRERVETSEESCFIVDENSNKSDK